MTFDKQCDIVNCQGDDYVNNKMNNGREVLHKLEKLCEKLDRMPTDKEVLNSGIVKSMARLKSVCVENGYENKADFCRKSNFPMISDIEIEGVFKAQKDLTLSDLVVVWKEYFDKKSIYPNANICHDNSKTRTRKDRSNLPNWDCVAKILRNNEISLNDFYESIDSNIKKLPEVERYDEYVSLYIKLSKQEGRYLGHKDLLNNKYGLPGARWFVDNCKSRNVTNFSGFVEWCGFVPTYEVSKEMATSVIYNMQQKLNRPLEYDDFRTPLSNEVGHACISKHWGTVNNMKRDLGLEIIREDMITRELTVEQAQDDVLRICKTIERRKNRKHITCGDIDELGSHKSGTYRSKIQSTGTTFKDYIESLGFTLQEGGRGVITNFKNGEKTLSSFEFAFSNFLRNELNLEFNVDYHKDVAYSIFIKGYDGMMSCDYVINYKSRKLYVEIAGLIDGYKNNYVNDYIIKDSDTKEKYRQRLKEKERMMKKEDLEYHILFPQDLEHGSLSAIFKG